MNPFESIFNQSVEKVDIYYDHISIGFLSGDGIMVNNIFYINFDGLTQLIGKKLLGTFEDESRIELFFENACVLTIDMTEDGYSNCPEPLGIYIKSRNERIFW